MPCSARSSTSARTAVGSATSHDDRHRWVLHRLWIAVGNEAVAHAQAVGADQYTVEPWNRLRQLRNHIAHQRLADIDDERIWRMDEPASRRDPRRVDAIIEARRACYVTYRGCDIRHTGSRRFEPLRTPTYLDVPQRADMSIYLG